MMAAMYLDRTDAGKKLAARLVSEEYPDPVVFALPRGGVPVAVEVARALGAPLDLLLVRKLGMPGHAELAAGAVVEGGGIVFNDAILAHYRLTQGDFAGAIAEKEAEIAARRRAWLDGREPADIAGRTAIVVDDGIATGATLKAALKGLRRMNPARIVAAVPVGPADTVDQLRALADDVICLDCPEPFYAVGGHYADFTQTSDAEVARLMQDYRAEQEDKK